MKKTIILLLIILIIIILLVSCKQINKAYENLRINSKECCTCEDAPYSDVCCECNYNIFQKLNYIIENK